MPTHIEQSSANRGRLASFLFIFLGFLSCGLPLGAARVIKLWEIPADGTRGYVSAAATERGITLNPVTDHVLIASRSSGVQIAVLNAATGAEVGFLNVDGVSGGSFVLGCLGVDDQGRIYAANVSGLLTVAPVLKIYRWDNEASSPQILFAGNPLPGANARWGESLAIRGSGAQTQILMGISSGASLALFRYTDATQTAFSPLVIDVPTANSGDFSRGLTFGNGDEFLSHGVLASQLKRCSFQPAAVGPVSGTVLSVVNAGKGLGGIAFNPIARQLAALDVVDHQLRFFDAATLSSLLLVGTLDLPDPSTPNASGLGQITLRGTRLVALDTQNGVAAGQITLASTGAAPTVKQDPQSVIYYIGAPVSFSVTAIGDAPLSYQWTLNGEALVGATNRLFSLSAAELADAGIYQVNVSNAVGSATSAAALLLLSDSVRSDAAQRLWTLSPGGSAFFPSTVTRVGVAWNPVSRNLLFLGTPPINALTVIGGDSGVALGTLTMAGELAGPGAVALQSVGIGDDGAIYACSVTTDGTKSPLRIYRWASDAAASLPQLIFSGDPGSGAAERWGDTLLVRKAGDQTEILLTSKNGSRFALLTPAGNSFAVQTFSVDLPPGSVGQGASFSGAHSFWAKAFGSPLFEIQWQAGKPVADVSRTLDGERYRSSVAAIGFIPSLSWMVGHDADEPEHVEVHDFTSVTDSPSWIDTEFFPLPGKNAGPNGSVAVGADRAFAASVEAGLIALRFGSGVVERPTLHVAAVENALTFTWQGNFVLQVGSNPEGPWTDIPGAQTGHTIPVNPALNQFFRLRQ